jgi:hypothetical protein
MHFLIASILATSSQPLYCPDVIAMKVLGDQYSSSLYRLSNTLNFRLIIASKYFPGHYLLLFVYQEFNGVAQCRK